MREALAVMAGGALGSLGRWLVAEWVAEIPWMSGFPFGTLLVNMAGSYGIGLCSEMLLANGLGNVSPGARAFLFAGVFGGFTTFSAFSLQTFSLLRSGQVLLGVVNIATSVILCLVAVWLGAVTAQWFAN